MRPRGRGGPCWRCWAWLGASWVWLSCTGLLAAQPALAPKSAPATGRLAPVVEHLEPASGPPGTVVHVIGRRFGSAARARIGALALEPVESVASLPNRVIGRVPEHAESGPITVVTAEGRTAHGADFVVTAARTAPRIDAVQPRSGPPGCEIVVRGSGFSPRLTGNRVTIGDAAVVVQRATPVQLVLSAPATPGAGALTVRVEHAGETTASVPFTVVVPAPEPEKKATQSPVAAARVDLAPADPAPVRLPPPQLHGFTPGSAPAGSEVAIEGAGFSPLPARNRVRIGAVAATVLEASATRLRVRIPAAPSGPLSVEVDDGGVARSSRPFIVTRPPRITEVTPARGPIGSELTIRGSGFGDNAAVLRVSLGGQPLRVRSVRADEIVARVPPGAVDGPLRVEIPLQGAHELPAAFEIEAAPE